MRKIIYLDSASTTAVREEVVLAMKPYWRETFANPSSITKGGVLAKKTLEQARANVALALSRRPNEIIFTAGGTESNNLAIFGLVNQLEKQGRKISDLHFITTNIEHSSILSCFQEIERRSGQVDYIKVDERGIINSRDLRKMIKPNTVLISVGYANNEIGTIQPIREVAKEIRHVRKEKSWPYFHTDASQAALYLDLNINQLGVDLLTLDAQKMSGPKGVGVLFKKAGVELAPIIFGGGQERGIRSGTENIPLIVGLAKALQIARKDFELKAKKIKDIRHYLWSKIQKEIPIVFLNGDLEKRLPNNLNFSIPGIDPEFTVLCLDEAGIVCSTKSACDRDAEESFVVRALGKDDKIVRSALRLTLDEKITKKDIGRVVKELAVIVLKQGQKE